MEGERKEKLAGWGILVVLLLMSTYSALGGFISDINIEDATDISQPTSTPAFVQLYENTGNTLIAEKDGMTLVFVPAGEFEMGSENGDDDESPVHTVFLDEFWIDQTEVTNAMFALFMEDTNYTTVAEGVGKSYIYQNADWELVWGADWQHPGGPETDLDELDLHPVLHMSWLDASAYCAWTNRRLPTAAEWEKAARGVDGRRYPWGQQINSDYLNYDSNLSETMPVGSYPSSASPYDALDMAGNVWEWVADWYVSDYYQNSPLENPLGPESGQFRELRGGSWGNSAYNTRASDRNFNAPGFTFIVNGFRCAASP